MAVNKNFVVKNGLEVNTNLILADAATDKVGIGTTVPGYTLDVAGGIGATSVYAAGFSTFIGDVKIGSAQTTLTAIGNSVGVGTDAPAFLLDIRSAVSTGTTSLYVKGDTRITGNLDVTGDISYDEVTGRNLYITGLSTFVGLSSAQDVRVGAGLSVVGVSTFHSNITVAGLSTFTGISTFGSAVHVGGALDVIGISTFKGNIDANGALDVDGHTELDDVNVSGASTFAGAIDANSDLDVDGRTDLDDLIVTGVSTFSAAIDANSTLSVASNLTQESGTFTIKNASGDANGLKISQESSNESRIFNHYNGFLTFGTSNAEKVRIDSSGRVGVGSTQPSVLLDVAGASKFAGAADFNGAVDIDGHTELDDVNVSGMATLGGANIVAAGGTFQVGAGGTVLYVDTDGTLTIGSATTLATVSLNGGSIPSIGLVIALGG